MTHTITGQRFGDLIAIERADDFIGAKGRKRTAWLCECQRCGNVKPIATDALVRNLQKTCGCARVATIPGYCRKHEQLREARGHASAYACVDGCGRKAQEWSYDHEDPNELRGIHGRSIVTYSLDDNHYQPRCSRCHREFDANPLVSGWKS